MCCRPLLLRKYKTHIAHIARLVKETEIFQNQHKKQQQQKNQQKCMHAITGKTPLFYALFSYLQRTERHSQWVQNAQVEFNEQKYIFIVALTS